MIFLFRSFLLWYDKIKREKEVSNMKKSIYNLTYEQLENWLVAQGEKRFRADQVWHWLYKKRVTSFSNMHNVNKRTIELLEEHFTIQTLKQEIMQRSEDGTRKFLFKLADGNIIETVLMDHHYGYYVCVTTQVGCNIGCSFCASGLLKKDRDLTTGEIVEQIVHVQRMLDSRKQNERISHIVVMGIGEPLDNFD